MRHQWLAFWPFFLGLPALAGVLQLILIAAGQPWTWRDLASSVVFAMAVAAATVMLACRQMDLQEATAILQQSLAQTKLVEKIGSITGALDDVATTGQASTAYHILIDARAGLNLLPYADEHARTEYIQTLAYAVSRLYRLVHDWTRPYTQWDEDDWPLTNRLAEQLAEMLEAHVPDEPDRGSTAFADLTTRLEALRTITGPEREVVPFTAFERSFRHPKDWERFAAADGQAVYQIRPLNWDLLRHYVEDGRAKITVRRAGSDTWLVKRTVYSVWYAKNRKKPQQGIRFAAYTDADAEAIPLNDIDRYHSIPPKGTKSTIESLAVQLEIHPDGRDPTVEIMTFRLTDDEVIVLDGNHRLAAMYYNRGDRPLPARLVEYCIEAPLDPALLPNLARHEVAVPDEAPTAS